MISAFHMANALTYASLICGVGALATALQGDAAACGSLLALAVVFDTFDGRFARYVRRRVGGEASIGAELDSLVDAVTFGIVPIACASVLFDGTSLLWWASAFIYVACAVTRLGFYNVSIGETPESAHDFVGLPTPVAALFWSSLFLLTPGAGLPSAVALATGAAMIAPIRVRRPDVAGLALFILWPVALIVVHVSRL